MFDKIKDILSGKWLLEVSVPKYIALGVRHTLTAISLLLAAQTFPGVAELGEIIASIAEPLGATITIVLTAAWGLLWSAREKSQK